MIIINTQKEISLDTIQMLKVALQSCGIYTVHAEAPNVGWILSDEPGAAVEIPPEISAGSDFEIPLNIPTETIPGDSPVEIMVALPGADDEVGPVQPEPIACAPTTRSYMAVIKELSTSISIKVTVDVTSDVSKLLVPGGCGADGESINFAFGGSYFKIPKTRETFVNGVQYVGAPERAIRVYMVILGDSPSDDSVDIPAILEVGSCPDGDEEACIVLGRDLCHYVLH